MIEVIVSERLASIGVRRDDVFRKYYKFGSENVARVEFRCATNAYRAGVPSPEPLGFGYSVERGLYYCDFKHLELQRIGSDDFSRDFFYEIAELANTLQEVKIRVPQESWSRYLRVCREVINWLPKKNQRNVLSFIDEIETESPAAFVHGDFSLENIGRDVATGKLILFDFQDACCGLPGWDLAYFLSSIPWRSVPVQMLDRRIEVYIKAITAIKFARGLRKGHEVRTRRDNFAHWWNTEEWN